jgi:bifunctional DNA-binding transcriptional regulator/antitoxin component of YhaV-PrlF toxin-antitoxin module
VAGLAKVCAPPRPRSTARKIAIHYFLQKVIESGKVIVMDLTITVTRKGQTTLPVAVRRQLGLAESGGVLRAHLNEDTGELILAKPPSITELSERVSRHIKPYTRPLLDVDEFYQSERRTQS